MSVTQNYFTNQGTTNYPPSQDTTGVPENWAIQGHGVRKAYFQSTVHVLTTDLGGSNYIILKDVPGDAIISKLEIETDGLTTATDNDIGLYNASTGVVIGGGNQLADAVDLHTAAGKVGSACLDGLAALTHEQTLQPVYLLAGDTLLNKKGTYDIVLTVNTATTAAGYATFRGEILPGG